MKEITVLSGKGGTGKTSITAALATIADHVVICDNDVDASNLHLIASPRILETHIYEGAWIARIDPEKCTSCHLCMEYCRFDAIDNVYETLTINPFKCEGCRLCERLCPEAAIKSYRSTNNQWFISESRFGSMVHARMGAGEENSGKLVSEIRKAAQKLARKEDAAWIINDGPPGIGCAAISSLTGVNGVLLVTEPSQSGLHDLKRLIELIQKFHLPAVAIINKYDLSPETALEIENYLQEQNIEIAARLPFAPSFVSAMVESKSIIEKDPESEIARSIENAWKLLKSKI